MTKPTCAIRNPSTSLLKALEANHTVYIKKYITFFTELPLKLGFLTNPIPGHNIITIPTVKTPLSYWDYAPVIQSTPWVPLFPIRERLTNICPKKCGKSQPSFVNKDLEDLLIRISITLLWTYEDEPWTAENCNNTPIMWKDRNDDNFTGNQHPTVVDPLPIKFSIFFI